MDALILLAIEADKKKPAKKADPALVQKIEELWTLAGLDVSNPLSVSTTERIAGDISQTIEESAGVVTVTRD